MAHLTNGTMSYERRVKTGDFEHKHAAVTINYALDEGDDADQLLALARTLVVQHVHAAVRGSPPPVPAADTRDPTPVQPDGPAVVQEVNRGFMVPESFTKPDAELLPRTTLKEALAEVIPVTNLKAAKRAVKKQKGSLHEHDSEVITEDPKQNFVEIVKQHGVDPTLAPGPKQSLNGAGSNAPIVNGGNVIEDPTSAPTVGPLKGAGSGAPVVGGGNVIEDVFTAVAPAATDAELAQALSRVNAVLKDRPRIQALIGEFVQSGQHYYMIPAVRRAEFVSKLEALV